MFILLVKTRLRCLRNTALYSLARHPLLTVGFTLLGAALFLGIFYGFGFFFALMRPVSRMEELVYEVFYFLFLFLLAGAVPFVASTLLHSADYWLLLGAPMPPRVIVASKLLDAAVTNSLQFSVIGIPAIAACGVGLALSWIWLPAILYLLVLFLLLPVLVTAWLLLIALMAVGIQRVRSAITTVNTLMAAIVCMTIVFQASHFPIPRGIRFGADALSSGWISRSPYNPSAWFAEAFVGLAQGRELDALYRIILLTAGVVLLFVACMVLGDRLISADSLVEEACNIATNSCGAGYWRGGLLQWLDAPAAGMVAKDLRYLHRDSVLLSQLAMPAILFFIPIILGMQASMRAWASPQEVYPFAMAMTGIIVFMQTSIISLSSIGLENRSFWLFLASPNGGSTLLWAKFLFSTLVSAGMGVLMTVLNTIIFRATFVAALVGSGIITLCAAALCGMGVGIAAALPRFVYENPAHRVSAWALILGFLTTTIYVVVVVCLLVGMQLLANHWPSPQGGIAYVIGGFLFFLISFFAAIVPLVVGARRIGFYQWEY